MLYIPNRKYNFFFLLGAGASCPAVPTVGKFVDDFLEHLNERETYFIPHIQFLNYLKDKWREIVKNVDCDLEHLYELLVHINNPNITPAIPFELKRKLKKSRESELLEYELKKYIQKRCLEIDLNQVKHYESFFEFFSLSPTLDFVTLNYDVCVEKTCDSKGRRYIDGFNKEDQKIKRGTKKNPLVRLHKLHGSVMWYEAHPGKYEKIKAFSQFDASLKTGSLSSPVLRGMLIYPGIGKSTPRGPFLKPAINFRQLTLNSELCISVGYRFADATVTSTIRDGFLNKPSFRLAIINPNPQEVMENLFPLIKEARKYSSFDFHKRLLVIDMEIEAALKNNYLFNRVKSWFDKRDFLKEKERTNLYINKFVKRIKKGSKNVELLDDFPRDLYGIAINSRELCGYITQPGSRGSLIHFDLSTLKGESLIKDLTYALGIAIRPLKSQTNIYLIENICNHTPWIGAFQRIKGAGRLWEIIIKSKKIIKREPITCKLIPQDFKKSKRYIKILWEEYKNWHKEETLNEIHKEFGILNWPNSVLIEKNNCSLLVTEARQLCRISIRTGKIEKAISIPMCFNLTDMSLINNDKVILLDVGVADQNSYGRLLRGNMKTGYIESIKEGITRAECLKLMPSGKNVLISKNQPFPYGEVIEVDIKNGKILRAWKGLDGPRGIDVLPNGEYALITSRKGLYRIKL